MRFIAIFLRGGLEEIGEIGDFGSKFINSTTLPIASSDIETTDILDEVFRDGIVEDKLEDEEDELEVEEELEGIDDIIN